MAGRRKNTTVNATDRSDRPLPKGWRMVRFDEIAENVTERVEPADAAAEGIERYVGLEHLDSESLKIRRWGTPDDVIGTKLRFKAGDIIFGRRRCYQRKLAVADFDGICSAHAMVLRAKENLVEADFLPFFMQSDMFMERALAISVGSLSPTINWRTLKVQEFPLPPRAEQRRIADILWAVEKSIWRYSEVISHVQKARTALVDHACAQGLRDGWRSVCLGDICIEKGAYGANAAAKPYDRSRPRYVRITDIDENGELIPDDPVTADVHDDSYMLADGDLLFARTGNTVGKVFLYRHEHGPCIYAGYLVRFRVIPDHVLADYVFVWTRGTTYRQWVRNTVRIGAQPNINGSEYASMKLVLPPLEHQQEIVTRDRRLRLLAKDCEQHVHKLVRMRSEILRSFLCAKG